MARRRKTPKDTKDAQNPANPIFVDGVRVNTTDLERKAKWAVRNADGDPNGRVHRVEAEAEAG